MAEKTGTLWENISDTAGCNHGFASYVLYWLEQLKSKYAFTNDPRLRCRRGELHFSTSIIAPKGTKWARKGLHRYLLKRICCTERCNREQLYSSFRIPSSTGRMVVAMR